MAQERNEKRLGRPLKAPTPGKRVALGLKVTSEIKQRLDEEARKSGRTQSQQAELMLERSFTQEDAFGGAATRQIAYLMAAAFAIAGQRAADGKADWTADLPAFVAGAAGVLDTLLTACPDGEAGNGKALAREALIGRLLSRRERDKEQST